MIATSVINACARLIGQRRFRLADRAKSRALLLGKLFNATGERMTPGYAVKRGVRYRYYVSVSAMQSRDRSPDVVHRVPAEAIEALVMATLRRNGVVDAKATADLERAETDKTLSDFELVERRIQRVIVHHDRVEITPCSDRDFEAAGGPVIVPWRKPNQHRHREILQPVDAGATAQPMESDQRARLLGAIASARRWLTELIDGVVPDLSTLATRERKTERSIRMHLSLAFLDPALITAAIDGRMPAGFGVSRLAELPARFDEQWAVLGLVRPS